MSISHPYLKQLKAHILNFCQTDGPIKDDNPTVLPFCRTLEDILRLGLTSYTSVQSVGGQRSYWPVVKSLSVLYPTHKLTAPVQFCIEHVDKCQKVVDNRGRERLFLRCALNKNSLALTFRLIKEKRANLSLHYNESSSIVAHEILSELFISLLVPLSQCIFTLNYKNSAFLDETWELPLYKKYEMVPCERLGLYLESVNSRLVVAEVESGSVADEDAKIEAGDVIDELLGECMRNGTKRKFISLMSEYQGSPIYISVLKCISHGEIYAPMSPLLEQLNLCRNALLANNQRRMHEVRSNSNILTCSSSPNVPASNDEERKTQKIVNERGMYPTKLCGMIYVGTIGSVEQIETGVVDVLKKEDPKRDIFLDMGETDIVVLDAHSEKILLQHGYPEIASCGRRIDYPLNFAYIAGETTCTLAKKFVCYVFEANCEDQARTVLQEIKRGFDRTHWAV